MSKKLFKITKENPFIKIGIIVEANWDETYFYINGKIVEKNINDILIDSLWDNKLGLEKC